MARKVVTGVTGLATTLLILAAVALGQVAPGQVAPGQAAPGQAAGGAGQPTAPTTAPALSAHDLELLHKLETGDWHTRKSAEAELADRDPSDAPILRAMMAQAANPEAKARLAQALATMKASGFIGDSRITLHVKDAPADQVYAEIFRQARAVLKPMSADLFTRPAIAPLTIDVDRLSFWTVMEQLYPKTGLMVVELVPGDFCLAHTAPIAPGPRVAYGPILLVATQVQAAVSLAIPAPPNPANPMAAFMLAHRPPKVGFGLVMTAYIEPRIKVLKMTPTVKIDQATDDNGNSLVSNFYARFAGTLFPQSDPGWPQLTAHMKFPDSKPGKRIAILRGTATFEVLLDTGKLDIPSPMSAGPSEFSINDKPVKFVGCTKVGNDYWVRFSTSGDKNDPWDMNVYESQANMHLLDADGHYLINAGPPPNNAAIIGGHRVQGGEADHTIVFRPATLPGGQHTGEPSKLEWAYPAKTYQIIVPIEFRDLDMNFQGQ